MNETCRPCFCENCFLCTLYHTSPRHKAAWDQLRDAPLPKKIVMLPCVHQGLMVERASCLCPRKNKYRCNKELGTVGICVPLTDCGEQCPGFEPEEE